jgi:ubiquinone/menaquinone biosynthesis C-methylase UbiE
MIAPMAETRQGPGRRVRLIGQGVTWAVARAPWLWPLLRGRVQRYFSDRAPGWDERTSAGSADYLAPLASGVLHVSAAPERILDVGCGTGEGTLFLAREFPQARVRGVDLSEEMIQRAIAKTGLDPEGRIAFKVGDASSLPYPDESFDLVTLLNMPPFFDEIVRVLRPGGSVIVASTQGDATPFYTPPKLLRWKFAQRGVEEVEEGNAGAGSLWVGRLTEPVPSG